MAADEEQILKALCGNHGSMDYERLLRVSRGLTEASLDRMIRDSGVLALIHLDSKEVFAQTTVNLCRSTECDGLCGNLHLCKFELLTGRCGRHSCGFGHRLLSEHNLRILQARHMSRLSREDLCVILMQSDRNLLPPVCTAYNRGRGLHGTCEEAEQCGRVHMCMNFLRGTCSDGTACARSHDFKQQTLRKLLRSRGVSHQLLHSIPFIYRNILTLRTLGQSRRPPNTEPEICLSFVRGFCDVGSCGKAHCKMPYEWQVKVGQRWHGLPHSQWIERDYCDPTNIHSSGSEPVCFEQMSLAQEEVRRLSTLSSVLMPCFALTTCWSWFWKDERGRWISYPSTVSHGPDSWTRTQRWPVVSSELLEQKYQEFLLQNHSAVVCFRSGEHVCELHFRDMKQRNLVSGLERPVRRRPAFVSALDVQKIRARCCVSSGETRFSKSFPRFWEQSSVPDSGFQRVRLAPSHRDYVKVQKIFSRTLSGFTVRRIERVQNRELWEDYMTKKEEMEITSKKGKYNERLLFRGSRSSNADAECHGNFDVEESDVAAAYGKGIYFWRDAKDCLERVDGSAPRLMLSCRVLTGIYTGGAAHFLHPPAKDSEGRLYDSCVDKLWNPSVYVVFDRAQIYPEFLITYEERNETRSDAQEDLKETSWTSTATPSPVWTSALTAPETRTKQLSSFGGTDTLSTVSTALPVSDDHVSTALPVSGEHVTTALPVPDDHVSNAVPVSDVSTALPVSDGHVALNAVLMERAVSLHQSSPVASPAVCPAQGLSSSSHHSNAPQDQTGQSSADVHHTELLRASAQWKCAVM